MSYFIEFAAKTPDLSQDFNGECWQHVPVMKIDNFRPDSTDHHPKVEFKLQYAKDGLYGLYQVDDRYVKAAAEKFQDMVCFDSCVEFFVQPATGIGYTNFEFSCGGTMLAQLVRDHSRQKGLAGFKDYRFLTEEEVDGIKVFHTMPRQILEEITEPVSYRVGFFIPFALFAKTHNAPVPVKGTVWRANVYKCADRTSHPHWASWQKLPITNFHTPEYFGELIFL